MLQHCVPKRALMTLNTEVLTQFFNAVKKNDITKLTELLKNKNMDVNITDETSYNRTAVHIAAEEGHYDLARILVDEYDADINIQDKNGQIPLEIACDSHNINIAKFLLQRDSKLTDYAMPYLNEKIVDDLFDAANSNDIEKIRELVKEKNVDVNSLDKSNYNRTVLHVAAANGYKELMHSLVNELGANIQLTNDFGETAKHTAMDNEHPELAEFLIERGYKDPYENMVNPWEDEKTGVTV